MVPVIGEMVDDVEPSTVAHALLLPPYIAISSFLGISGDILVSGQLYQRQDPWALFLEVWSASLAAGFVFIILSTTAAVLTYRTTRSDGVWYGLGVGLGLTLLAYLGGFALLPEPLGPGGVGGILAEPGPSLLFVWGVGIYGILFAAISPVLLALAEEHVPTWFDDPKTGPQHSSGEGGDGRD